MRAPAALLAALLVTACGAPAQPTAATALPSARDTIFVRDGDDVVAIDGGTGRVERTLGPGILSADRTLFHGLSQTADETTIRTIDVGTGAVLRSGSVPGHYAAIAYGPSGLSSHGQKLVLQSAAKGTSGFAVLDAETMRVLARVDVPGHMDFDGIDDAGSSLYLLEHPVAGSIAYNVRLYDVWQRTLLARPITDQKIIAEPTPEQIARGTMGGIYLASAMPGSGWQLTLALHPEKGPFVHALNLGARYASCLLNVPGGDRSAPGLWAIAVTRDGLWAYIVNPGAGALARLDTATLGLSTGPFLAPLRAAGVDVETRRGAAVLSPDGSRLYAVGPRGIVVIDTSSLSMRGTFMPDRVYDGLALSADGVRLYALSSVGGTIDRLDASTGRPLGQISSPASRELLGAAAR